METKQTYIFVEALNIAKKHCKDNGIKLVWFISEAVKEKVKRDKK